MNNNNNNNYNSGNYNGYNGNYANGYGNNPNGAYNNGYNNNPNGAYTNGYSNNPNGNYTNGFNNNPDGAYNNEYNNSLDSYGVKDPRIPDEIYNEHPDAKIVTKRSGIMTLIVTTLICFSVCAIFVFLFFYSDSIRAETDRIIDCDVTVEGVITDTWKRHTSTYKSTKTTYYASYDYFYNDSKYTGETQIQAGRFSIGDTVTVYVDPENPSDSRLFRDNMFLPYSILLGVIPFITIWILMIGYCHSCIKGRMVKYKAPSTRNSYSYKTVYKKIR